ncbi:hypothetical protein OEG84_22070 [Hoeflea sp. G2-23]|uniref:Transposase n=1 Tax=Hoeflea algicola TaxID=2983763 RepID=A0ABT3ZFB2_9HYPH|nr:hypothetical protein [Hoeflea algicola]MCY0150318.1 hypothetical protein [Hoeflea algicola]
MRKFHHGKRLWSFMHDAFPSGGKPQLAHVKTSRASSKIYLAPDNPDLDTGKLCGAGIELGHLKRGQDERDAIRQPDIRS